MAREWKVKPRVHKDLIQHLLALRGIVGEKNVADFLHADYSSLNSPFLFNEMEKAVQRIWQAIENQETILIYSDYDADAITANAVLFRTFKFLGIEAQTYIPDRFSEGYGLNLEAFQKIKDLGATLVITVDCGTNSVDEAEFCRQNGIDLIITDHHEITGELPGAFALINPKNPAEKYPYKQLVGVGVAFKLATAIISKRDKHNLAEGYEKWLLDLVAIGTVADCHSLIGENRILVKYGLKVLEKTKWPGLRAIMDLAGFGPKANFAAPRKLDTFALGYVIAPRINAAGRIEHASIAFDCLATDDPTEAKRLAQELEKINSRRQLLTENVMSEAREQLTQLGDHKVLLAAGKDWPKGIVGLVAGKLAEEFGKPVFIMDRGEEFATGSARSTPTFNVVEALKHSQALMVKFGGHAAAAGYTLRSSDVEKFHKALLEFAEQNLDAEPVQFIEIDAETIPEDITIQTLDLLDAFEPYGVDNFKPKFLLSNIKVRDVNSVGKENKHLQVTFHGNNKFFKSIGFNFGRSIDQFKPGENVDLIFEFLADNWNGNKNVKLRLIDFRKANNG